MKIQIIGRRKVALSNKEKLLKILMEINPDVDYEKEKAIVDDGIYDSLEVMSVVTEIEDKFHLNIDPDDVVAEKFNSLETILGLIEKAL